MPSFNKKTLKILSLLLALILGYQIALSYAKERIEDTALDFSAASYNKIENVNEKLEDIREETRKQEKKKYIAANHREVKCLADNIYYEAGYEPTKGKIAVAGVTINRVKNSKFPKSVCSVVYQRTRGTCQFSWTCMKKYRPSPAGYAQAKKIAEKVLTAEIETTKVVPRNVLFYHADYVNPRWGLDRYAKIGRHIFYAG
jgi:spore germination cell wall hydrolase CwlJ-like protein